MARTFTPLTGGGASDAYAAGDKWGYQTAEKVRQALDVFGYQGFTHFLGGSDIAGVASSSYVPVHTSCPITLNGDNFGGYTLEAVVFRFTRDAATSVTCRIYNVTDGSAAVTGSASTSTTAASETLTITMASGNKSYRLECTGSNTTNDVFAWGFLRLRKDPA